MLDFDFIPESREQHEVLLGADILYNFSDNAVQDALPKLLAPGGRFIHAEPDNHFSGARRVPFLMLGGSSIGGSGSRAAHSMHACYWF